MKLNLKRRGEKKTLMEEAMAILYEGFNTWQRKVKGFATVPPIEAFIQWEQFKEVIVEKMEKHEGGSREI